MVLESMYDPLVVVDSIGLIVYVNPAYTRELGTKASKVVGKEMQKVAPEAIVLKVLKTGKPVIEVHSRIKNLGIDIIVNSTPIYKDGNITGAVSVFRNVTTIRKLNE